MINSLYIAYPIDQRGHRLSHLFAQIEQFKARAVKGGVSWVFDPGDAFTVNPAVQIDGGLAKINRAALFAADGLVAFLPAGVASIGVPIEIDRARAMGKPVLVLSDADSFMLEMPGIDRLSGWDDGDLDTAIDWISQVEPSQDQETFGFMPFTGQLEFRPHRHYRDDAGLDLFVSEDTLIPAHAFKDVPCGVSVQLPERRWAMITGRSSALRKLGLLVHTGIIDTGYRGPLFAAAYNMTGTTVKVKKGERIAQMITFFNDTMHWLPEQVEALEPSARGNQGFGSTGI